jgi:hypothetical protein
MKKFFCGTALLMSSWAASALATPNCETFSGLWTQNVDGSGAQLTEFYIDDQCKVFSRAEEGYWNRFIIDGDYTLHHPYDHPRFTQLVRGTWNKDKTELMIETFDGIESDFDPAFGKGRSRLIIEKWRLDSTNTDVLIIESKGVESSRDDFSMKVEEATEYYYRQPE